MIHVTYFYIWKTLWYMYNTFLCMEDIMVHVLYYVAQAAAAGAFMRYGAGGRLGRWGCSRSMNRVAPPGGDGGLTER